jgi:hypothetical protein
VAEARGEFTFNPGRHDRERDIEDPAPDIILKCLGRLQ